MIALHCKFKLIIQHIAHDNGDLIEINVHHPIIVAHSSLKEVSGVMNMSSSDSLSLQLFSPRCLMTAQPLPRIAVNSRHWSLMLFVSWEALPHN